jgi:hypothetical protein
MKYDNQIMKFNITDTELQMSIKIDDIVWLFHNSPYNCNLRSVEQGIDCMVKVKQGKEKEFAEYVVKYLMEFESCDSHNTNWSAKFDEAFNTILEGAEDEICDYEGY